MIFELLYFDECQNYDDTVKLLSRILEAEGMSVEIPKILISNHDDAHAHSFPGSPTLRVNSLDIEEDIAAHQVGISYACRTHTVEDKPHGVLPRAWLEHLLRAARTLESVQ